MADDLETQSAYRQRIGFSFVAIAAIGFGVSPTYAKLAYHGGAEPLTLVAARFTLCVLAMVIIAGLRQNSLKIKRGLLYVPLLMGALLAWNAAGYLSAVKEIPVSLAAALFYTFPLQIGLFSLFLGLEVLSARRIFSLFLGFCGVLLVISFVFDEINNYGVGLALSAGCGVALSSLLFAKAANNNNSVALMLWSMLTACFLSWILAFFVDGFEPPDTQTGWYGFLISMFGFSLAVIGYYLALPMIGAVRAAIVANLEPVIAVLMAVLILGERLGFLQAIGIVLIVIAVYLGGISSAPKSG